MSETLLNMQQRVSRKLGGKESWKSEIINALNEASQQLAWQIRPHEVVTSVSFTTTDSDFDYDFGVTDDINATNIYAPIFLRNETDNNRLVSGTFAEFLQVRNDSAGTGQPSKWARYANQIILYNQIPDGGTTRTIRVYYVKRLTKMTDPTDTFQLNDEWIRPVEELATAMVMKDQRDFAGASATLSAYNGMIAGRETPEMFDDASPEGGFIPISNTMMDGFQL